MPKENHRTAGKWTGAKKGQNGIKPMISLNIKLTTLTSLDPKQIDSLPSVQIYINSHLIASRAALFLRRRPVPVNYAAPKSHEYLIIVSLSVPLPLLTVITKVSLA
jgi:hypothetical protein